MKREDIIYYFKSLQMVYVLMATIQLGIATIVMYLNMKEKVFTPGQNPEWLMYLSPIGIVLAVSALFLHGKDIKVMQKKVGAETKLKTFRKITIRTWLLLVTSAVMVDVMYLLTAEFWILGLSAAILIPFLGMFITQMKVIRTLKLSRGEAEELKAIYSRR